MDTHRQWHIYILLDPRTGEVRYVGWAYDVTRRLGAHIRQAKNTVSHKAHWIRQLLQQGLQPQASILESGTGDWREAERWWISHYRANGARLTNATDGGDGTPGYYPDESTRRKMAQAHTGRKQAPESIAKTRAGLLGRKQSEEHVAKLALTRKGKVPWTATQAAARVVRGKKQSPAHIKKRIAPRIGKIRPEFRKLTDDQVRLVRSSAGTVSLRTMAARLGVGQTLIFAIRHRLAYQDVAD